MKNLIKLLILMGAIIFSGCSFSTSKIHIIQTSTYPSKSDLTMIIESPVLAKTEEKKNILAFKNTLEFLKRLQEDKDVLDVNKTSYSSRFDDIILKTGSKERVQRVYSVITTLKKHLKQNDFQKNAIIESIIDDKEPLKNTFKVGFEVLDTRYPSLIGFRSVLEEGKKRYTELISLKNINGDSDSYTDMKNLIKFFLLMPIKTNYAYKNSYKQYTIVKEIGANKYQIERYKTPKQFWIYRFNNLISQEDINLAQKFNILDKGVLNKKNIFDSYCKLFDLVVSKENKFYENLPIYQNTKAKLLNNGASPYSYTWNNIYCESPIPLQVENEKLVYKKDSLNHIVNNTYISNKQKLSSSPLLDVAGKNTKVYSSHLNGVLSITDLVTKQTKDYKITNKIPLFRIALSGSHIILGDIYGKIYIFDLVTNRVIKSFKAHKSKIVGIQVFDKNKLITASQYGIVKVWNINTNYKLKKTIDTKDHFLKDLVIYRNSAIAIGMNLTRINLSDMSLVENHAYFSIIPRLSASAYENKVATLSSNNVLEVYSLEKNHIQRVKKFTINRENQTKVSSIVLYKNLAFIGSRAGKMYVVETTTGKRTLLKHNFGKITKIRLKENGLLYIVNHSGKFVILDAKLWDWMN